MEIIGNFYQKLSKGLNENTLVTYFDDLGKRRD